MVGFASYFAVLFGCAAMAAIAIDTGHPDIAVIVGMGAGIWIGWFEWGRK